jgi:hypothetical protein
MNFINSHVLKWLPYPSTTEPKIIGDMSSINFRPRRSIPKSRGPFPTFSSIRKG